MDKHEITAVDEGSSFGNVFRPNYRSYSTGIGGFVVNALSNFSEETGLGLQRLASSYTARRLTGTDLTTQRAQAATDLAAGSLSKITGVVATGNRYTWTFADNVDSVALASTYTLTALLNALLDGDLTAELTTGSITHTAVATNDWIFLDIDNAEIHYGPGSVTFGNNFTTPVPTPEVTLTPRVADWLSL